MYRHQHIFNKPHYNCLDVNDLFPTNNKPSHIVYGQPKFKCVKSIDLQHCAGTIQIFLFENQCETSVKNNYLFSTRM